MFPVEWVYGIIVVVVGVVAWLGWDHYTGPDYSEFDGWMK